MVVSKLTPKIVQGAPFADGSSYYVMEGRSRRSLLRGKQLAGSRKTMADLGADYLRRHARPHKAARSAEEDERMWQRSVLPALGDRVVYDVTAEQIQDLHVAMAETPFAANRVLALLSKAFNLAEL